MKRLSWMILIAALLALSLCCAVSASAEIVESGTMASYDRTGDGEDIVEDNGTWSLDDQGVLFIDCVGLDWDDESIPNDVVRQANTIRLGARVEEYNVAKYYYMKNIVRYEVDEANEHYDAIDGFLCSKDHTKFMRCPPGYTGVVTVPDGFKVMAWDVFYECDGVTEVRMPDSIETIEQQSFSNCDNIKTVTIPKGTTDIHRYAFNRSLEAFYVDADNAVYTAADGVLMTKEPYAIYLYPGSKDEADYVAPAVAEVAQDAFRWLSNVKAVTFPEGLTAIRQQAFYSCSIQSIHLPATLTTVEQDAFSGCDQLADVYFAGTKAQWKKVAVSKGNSALELNPIHCSDGDYQAETVSGTIGYRVGYVMTMDGDVVISGEGMWNSDAFRENRMVRHVMLSDGVTEVGWSAFYNCENLESALIPDTVTEIKYYAFYGCKNLKALTIPAGVTEMGDEMFDRCSSLRDIYFGGTMAQWNDMVNPETNSGMLLCTVHCADGDVPPAYLDMEDGYTVEKLTDTVTQIEISDGYAFIGSGPLPDGTICNYYGPEILDVGEGITDTGDGSFCYVDLLKTVYLPASLERVGDNVLTGCDRLERVYYAGTRAQWAEVEVSESANPDLESLLVCADDEAYPPALFKPAFGKSEYTLTGFITGGVGESLSERFSDTIWMTNYDELRSKLSGEPAWSLTHVDGPDLGARLVNVHPYEVAIYPDGDAPDEPAAAVYRLACEWGGQSTALTLNVVYKDFNMGFPEGIDAPDVLEVNLNETFDLQAGILPDDWEQEGVTPVWSLEANSGLWVWQEELPNAWHMVAYDAGDYSADISLKLGNVVLTKTVAIHVEDSNDPGNLTRLNFCSWNDHDEATYYLGVDDDLSTLESDRLQLDPFVTQYWLNGYEDYREQLEGDPVFNCEFTALGTAEFEITPHPNWEQPCVNVDLIKLPDSPEVDVLKLSCDWGDLSWEQEYVVTFKYAADGELPTGVELNIDDPLTFVASTQFCVADMIAFSDGWTGDAGEFRDMALYYDYSDGHWDEWEHVEWDSKRHCPIQTLGRYGEFAAAARLTYGRLVWQHPFTVRVTDENGVIPLLDTYVYGAYEKYYLDITTEGETDDVEGVCSNNTFGDFGISFLTEEPAALENASWSWKRLEGTAEIRLETWDENGYYGNVMLEKAPGAPEKDVFELTFTYNGIEESKRLEMDFTRLPEGVGLPTGIELNHDVVYGVVGEVSDTEPDEGARFANGWDFEGAMFDKVIAYNTGTHWSEAGQVYDEPAINYATVYVNCCNIQAYKRILLIVTDEDGVVPADAYRVSAQLALSLPEDLTTIQAGAFEGVAPDGMVEVHIPSGVTAIEEGAFDGNKFVFCFTDSDYVKQYCLDHGLIPVME